MVVLGIDFATAIIQEKEILRNILEALH